MRKSVMSNSFFSSIEISLLAHEFMNISAKKKGKTAAVELMNNGCELSAGGEGDEVTIA